MKNTAQKQANQSVNAEAAKLASLSRSKKKGGSILSGKYAAYAAYGIFGALILAGIIAVIVPSGKKLTDKVIVPEEIASRNAQNLSFKVAPNSFFAETTLADVQKLLMNQLSHKSQLIQCASKQDQNIIDLSYDFRTKFPQCIRPVADQGNKCGSSYSIATTSSVADRFCADSDGVFNNGLSAQPFISCYEGSSYQCEGGFVSKTFQKGKTTGFVKEECLPYHGTSSKEGCQALKNCEHFKIFDYCIVSTGESIKREIMLNGPVVAVIAVYDDFLTYSSGIYHVLETSTRLRGQQAIKIIGWDSDPVTQEQYWIIENSWGETWGQNGYAFIEMGNLELLDQEYAMASISLSQAESLQAKANASASDSNSIECTYSTSLFYLFNAAVLSL